MKGTEEGRNPSFVPLFLWSFSVDSSSLLLYNKQTYEHTRKGVTVLWMKS